MSRSDVALDARETSHMSLGMRRYARELVARLPQIAPDLSFERFDGGDNFDWPEQVEIPLALARARPRLAHFLAPYAPLVVPVPYVVTIHDLIDLRYPEFTKPKAVWYYRFAVRRIARRALAVLTDDDRTADDLVRFYGIERERIEVVPLGVDLAPCEPMRHERPYVIYVGNRRGHKDLKTLFEGWERADPHLELDLVVTGDSDPALAARARERGRVVFIGEPGGDELMRWVAGARALVHAALAEGFGLPLLEAMRLGTPVIASDASTPGILRPHARTFAAGDAGELARAIASVAAGENNGKAERARTATAGLTWERCAEATADLYRRLLRNGAGRR